MLMESNKIQELLERYWKAETTLEEEAQLRSYFSKSDVPEQLRETASLFLYFEQNKKKELADDAFNMEVLSEVKRSKKGKIISLVYNSMRIAAGIAVLAIAVWFIRKEVNGPGVAQVEDTYQDPKLAFEETKKALLMISKSFGTAEAEARKINLFNEAKNEIEKKPESTNDL
jgi:hypothetical protein